MINKKYFYIILPIMVIVIACACMFNNNENRTLETSSGEVLSNKKIGWGIKRAQNNEQPDLGTKNLELINENNDMAMGNPEDKFVYLTFDNGYEAGYTAKILDILKENNVKAAFFITGHYLNTASDLVERMINEGHIVGNHISVNSMYLKEKSYES